MRPHLFELMDIEWMPNSLRLSMRDVLEISCSKPFRFYYDWLVGEVVALVHKNNYEFIAELGAGTAPVTRRLLKQKQNQNLPNHIKLGMSDLFPDVEVFKDIELQSKGSVLPTYIPVDHTIQQNWPPRTLAILSSTFHHLPQLDRIKSIRSLEESKVDYIIAEAIRNNFTSILACLVFDGIIALAAPLFLLRREGNMRRFFWTYIVPALPVMFTWDGVVSCWRCWTENEWGLVFAALGKNGIDSYKIKKSPIATILQRFTSKVSKQIEHLESYNKVA